tara:strand:+ start:635 stop:1258 length:624 start_codon:yes stop_codon:yes gene_type:complete
MIKGILFDLDGVLVSTQILQVSSTLNALKHHCKLNNNIRSLVKQTITTQEKLKILADGNYLKKSDVLNVYKLKKKLFNEKILKKRLFSKKIYKLFEFLKKNKFKLALVTNGNKQTSKIILKKLKIEKFFNIIVTNNSKVKPKPNPAPYLFAISYLKLKKENCLILEDSPVGILSAQRSGAKYYKVNNPKKVNLKNLKRILNKYSNII